MTTTAKKGTAASASQGDGDGTEGAGAAADTPKPGEALSEAQSLGAALLEFHRQAPTLVKDETAEVPTKSGGKYTYSYLTLDTLFKAVRPVLNEVGLVMFQTPTFVDSASGAPLPALTTRLLHPPSGEEIGDTMLLLASQSDPQGQGSALTYARRYAAMAILGLAADDDDDGAIAQEAKQREKKAVEAEQREQGKLRQRRDKIAELCIALDKQASAEAGTWWALVEQETLRQFGVAFDSLKVEELDEVGKTLKGKAESTTKAVPDQLEFEVPF